MPLLREQECPIRVSRPRTSGEEDDSETEFHLPGMLGAFRCGGVINNPARQPTAETIDNAPIIQMPSRTKDDLRGHFSFYTNQVGGAFQGIRFRPGNSILSY